MRSSAPETRRGANGQDAAVDHPDRFCSGLLRVARSEVAVLQIKGCAGHRVTLFADALLERRVLGFDHGFQVARIRIELP